MKKPQIWHNSVSTFDYYFRTNILSFHSSVNPYLILFLYIWDFFLVPVHFLKKIWLNIEETEENSLNFTS